MKDQTREEAGILAAAERQMHAWAMAAQADDRVVRSKADIPLTRRAIRHIAVSREAGAGGSEIALALGQQLGWEVFDKNLLDRVADRFHLSRLMLDLVDETRGNWVYDVLGTWMDRKIVTHEKYFARLSRIVLAAARTEHAVFVGRGVQYLLPPDEVLAVRIVASPDYRLRKIMTRTGMSVYQARRWMLEMDEGRREFVERFFHHDIADPHYYHLVVNVERCGQESAVMQILAAMQRC